MLMRSHLNGAMTNRYPLTPSQIDELECAHRTERDKRFADRIKAVCLLDKDWPVSRVAEALIMDRKSVRNISVSLAM